MYRGALIALALLPPGLALVLGAASVGPAESVNELSCQILPNGRVLRLLDECPLRTNNLVRTIYLDADGSDFDIGILREATRRPLDALRVGVFSEGAESTYTIPVRTTSAKQRIVRFALSSALTILLLFLPLRILSYRSEASIPPFLLLNSIISAIATALIFGATSIGLQRVLVTGFVLLPGVIVHLSIVFPRERNSLLSTPLGLGIPYGLTFALIPPVWSALERSSLIWPSIAGAISAIAISAWAILLLSCAFAASESASPMERARSHVIGWGASLLPIAPTVILAPPNPTLFEVTSLYVISAAASTTIPVALAISRYNLFSLGEDLRIGVSRTLYVAIFGGLVGVCGLALDTVVPAGLSSLAPASLVLLSMAVIALLEPIRAGILRLVSGRLTPAEWRFTELQAQFARELSEFRDAVDIANLLAKTIRDALAPERGWIFLAAVDRLIPTAAVGGDNADFDPDTADIRTSLADSHAVHLTEGPAACLPHHRALSAQGAQLLLRLDCGGTRFGAVVLGPPQGSIAYSRHEIAFATTLVDSSAVALRNAGLAENLVVSESRASRATFAAGLLHDLGKEINWIRMISGRLPQRLGNDEVVRQELGHVHSLSQELIQRIRAFILESEPGSASNLPVPRAIERAIESVSRRCDTSQVDVSVAPEARELDMPSNMVQAIANLVENSLHACVHQEPILVVTSVSDDILAIDVVDRGTGLEIPDGVDPFRLGFTTRKADGGTGVGLALAREIVSANCGTISLQPHETRGTRAEIRLPIGTSVGFDASA